MSSQGPCRSHPSGIPLLPGEQRTAVRQAQGSDQGFESASYDDDAEGETRFAKCCRLPVSEEVRGAAQFNASSMHLNRRFPARR